MEGIDNLKCRNEASLSNWLWMFLTTLVFVDLGFRPKFFWRHLGQGLKFYKLFSLRSCIVLEVV